MSLQCQCIVSVKCQCIVICREEDQARQEEYQKRLEEMKVRVEERPLLVEQARQVRFWLNICNEKFNPYSLVANE